MLWEDNYLAHHGVKGQKWGVRRYQNEDGSLTPEGKARREELRKYLGRGAANFTEPGVDRESRLMRKIAKAEVKGKKKKAGKIEEKLVAQQKANDDAKEWAEKNADLMNRHERWTKTSRTIHYTDQNGTRHHRKVSVDPNKIDARDLRLYNKSRARGASPTRAFVETYLPGGMLLRAIGNKKKYGKALVYDVVHEDDFVTTASPEDNIVPFGESDGAFRDRIVNSAEGSVSYGVKGQTWGVARGTGELVHYGIKGQKWGVRRFQNEDGSLTPAGKERYYTGSGNGNKSSMNAGRGSESGTAGQSSGRSVKEAVQSKAVTAGGASAGGLFSRVKKNWEEMVYPPEMRNKSKEEKKTWEKGENKKFDRETKLYNEGRAILKETKNFDKLDDEGKKALGDKVLQHLKTLQKSDDDEGGLTILPGDDLDMNMAQMERWLGNKIAKESGTATTVGSATDANRIAKENYENNLKQMSERREEIKQEIGFKKTSKQTIPLNTPEHFENMNEIKRLTSAEKADKIYSALEKNNEKLQGDWAKVVLQDIGFRDTPENRALIWPYIIEVWD